jgi:hypothetical protein
LSALLIVLSSATVKPAVVAAALACAASRPARNAQEYIAVKETCSPAEQAAIAAFKNGASVNRVAGLIGRKPGSVEWLLKKNGLKRNDHRKPRADEAGDAIPVPTAQSCRKADLAFQRAMHRAIKAGLENPR